MSVIHLLAYDFPLPEVDMRQFKEGFVSKTTIGFLQGFSVINCYCSKDNVEVFNLITKKYCHDVGLTEEDSCIENFKNYLFKYMKPHTEIEIWSIYLGGDYSKHYTMMPRLNNIPLEHLLIVNDEIDYFTEYYFKPVKKEINLSMMSKKDVLFVLENTSVCLIIKD